ncbi:MAG: hypothetical protein JNM85_09265 [Chthonomonas sp.]|nr:hypothetical protein [Chthonomonas sp.]
MGASNWPILQLVAPNSGWFLTGAQDINDNTYIVGRSSFQGVAIDYILTPVPEPSTVALALGSLRPIAR